MISRRRFEGVFRQAIRRTAIAKQRPAIGESVGARISR